MRPIAEHEQEIRVRHLEPFLGTFPQLIRSREDFRQSVAAALASLQKHEPVTVYGERGTGKRILAGTLQQRLDAEESRLFDVTVIRGSDEAFAQLRRLLAEAQADSMILLRGLERFQPALQRRLVEVLGACRAYLVVAFEKPPQRLKEEGWLEEELYAFLGRTVVGMKPSRDNLGELEELIRIFISENNEKYGKQVVGIRPKVLDSFYTRPWKGNLIELRDTIGELVRSAQGEYIDEEPLHWFEKNKSVKDAGSGSRTVNLDQPFQSIQKDIIQMVLQEENMNQSRAAKRLGLNRSTLWRILKDQP
ncbi:hypothetical protein LJK88_16235 [Paenibacillus sp. P26]|nr:hypothetical protein LJK88_16235 [Paenibacillus sp. P26]